MERVLFFLNDYVVLIYIILFIALVFTIRKYLKSIREKAEAVFGLEIESATRHKTTATILLFIILIIALLEFFIVFVIIPSKPEILSLSTPTIDLVSMPASTIPPEIINTIIARTPGATITNVTSNCIPGMIMITYPKAGDQIRGNISILGTANVPNFGFYKYEFNLVGTTSWSTIQAGREIKIDSRLGDWDTSEIVPGDYKLRLVVLDNQGYIFPECEISIRVLQP